MTIVSYVLADGTRGSFTAPATDRVIAIGQTRELLASDGEVNFSITGAK